MCRMVQQPEFVVKFLRIIQDWQNWALEVVLDVGVDMVSRFGLYEGPYYWGYRYFQQYLEPLIEEETRIVHEAGVLHAQGSSEDLTAYRDLFQKMQVDILMGVDEIQGRDDFTVLKDQIGDEKAFWGGINSDVTLGEGSEGDIRNAVARAFEVLAPGGGFVLWPVWSVYHHVPWSNVEILIDCWKQHRNQTGR